VKSGRKPLFYLASRHAHLHSPIHRGVLYFVLLTTVGILGYMWIEGASANDALYMTVITETAVGYSETISLSQAGRTFTRWT
jgi:Ion channel